MVLANKNRQGRYTYQNGFYEIEENNKHSLYNKNGNLKYKNADSICFVRDYFLIEDGGDIFRLDAMTETFLEDINR